VGDSSGELLARGGEPGGFDAEGLGRGNQVWFVRAEEIEHRQLDLPGGDTIAQDTGRQARQVEKTLRPALVLEDPGESLQGEPRGVCISNP
jgi:hypothetical protein